MDIENYQNNETEDQNGATETVEPVDTDTNGDNSTGDTSTGSASGEATTENNQNENTATDTGAEAENGGTNPDTKDDDANDSKDADEEPEPEDKAEDAENGNPNTDTNIDGNDGTESENEAEAEANAPFDPNASYSQTLRTKNEHKCLKKAGLKATSLSLSLVELSLFSIVLGPVLGIAAFLVLNYNAEINAAAKFFGYNPKFIPTQDKHDEAKMQARKAKMKGFISKTKNFTVKHTKSGLFNARVGGKQLFQSAKRYFGARHRNRVNSRNNNGPTPAM